MRSRRFVSIVLALWMWGQVPECSSAAPLEVGVARVDITPPLGYPMSGYYHARGATGVLDPLEAKSLVLRQGETRVALCMCDLIGIPAALTEEVRRRVAAETDIPAHHVILTATHTHTGPAFGRDLAQLLNQTSGDREAPTPTTDYPARLISSIARSIVDADRDRSAATLEIGKAEVDHLSFNRRFLLKDGKARTWAKLSQPDVVKAAGPIDPDLGMVLVRDGTSTAPLAALAVFALHLDTTGGTEYSADFPHYMEEVLRQQIDDRFTLVFGAGTCGDINHVDPRGAERRPASEIGRILARAFSGEMAELERVQAELEVTSRVVHVPLQPAETDKIAWAKEIVERDRQGEELDFLTEVEAYKVLAVAAIRQREGGAGSASISTMPVDIHAVRLGPDAAIVTLPGEVFVQLGLDIKRRSPFEHTLVVELACSSDTKYIATRAGYAQGGYEPTNSAVAPGAGEQLADAAVELLHDLARSPRP